MFKLSKFHAHSLGIVAANKPLDSKIIEVTPIEDNPMASGELTDNIDIYEAKSSSTDGEAYQVELTTTNTIKATWLPIGTSNRLTAPDVRRHHLHDLVVGQIGGDSVTRGR